MMKLGTKIAAVTFVLLAAGPALAGKGGSAAKIQSAVTSGSVDAIVAEIERAESLMCERCVGIVTNLLEDDRYAVREAAAWWFAKRPAIKDMLATQFVTELASGDTIAVRNAADFLGRTMTYTSLPALRTAIKRTDVGADAKLAMVRAVKYMAHQSGNPVRTVAMTDADATVRAAAVAAWRDIRGQKDATPAVSLLASATRRCAPRPRRSSVRWAGWPGSRRSRRSSSATRIRSSGATRPGRSASSARRRRGPR